MSDPKRRAILARPALREMTVTELVEPFEISQPAISRRLKVLEDAGWIVKRVEGAKRPCRTRRASAKDWLEQLRKKAGERDEQAGAAG